MLPSVLRIRGLELAQLHIDDFTLAPGETWCVLGENGAGKSLLAAAICGTLPEADHAVQVRPKRVSCASFESQQALYEHDLANDDSNFLGGGEHGATALQVLQAAGRDEVQARALAARLELTPLLDRKLRALSSGEARRLMVLRALAGAPDLLVLDEPFEGLDPVARTAMHELCARLIDSGQALLLLVNRRADVGSFSTHLALLRDGRLVLQGPREQVLAAPQLAKVARAGETLPALPPPPPGASSRFDPVLALRACSVRYGDIVQFAEFDWMLRPGAHTLIVGENGCGKSTLLQLLCGDHPQCYTNDMVIVGYKRGSGESIWDIKQHIGLVSPALHRDYRASATALEVIVSGLYDSIGLYRAAPPHAQGLARAWLSVMGMAHEADRSLRALSYGQQRLVLIARALIKQPPLLILDEPTQGLDDENRARVLAFLERLSALERTTLLLVSHRHDEHLPLFQNRLAFERSARPGVRYEVRVSGDA